MTSDDAAGTTTVPTDTGAFGLATDEVRAGADPVAQATGPLAPERRDPARALAVRLPSPAAEIV